MHPENSPTRRQEGMPHHRLRSRCRTHSLASIEENGSTTTLAYDGAGNLVRFGSEERSYDARNQLVSRGAVRYHNDANGNLATKTDADGVTTRYRYDTRDRLVQVERDGAVLARYGYDPFGQRLWKEAGGRRSYFFYSDEGLVAEITSGGRIDRTYAYLPDGSWSQYPVFLTQGGERFYVQHDMLGAPRALVTEAGAVAWKASYGIFGNATVAAGSGLELNFRLPGQYFDAETGLHYNNARYYDPDVGRFITLDPSGFASGMNGYLYAGNNPVGVTDPSGLFSFSDALGGLAGAVVDWAGSLTATDFALFVLETWVTGLAIGAVLAAATCTAPIWGVALAAAGIAMAVNLTFQLTRGYIQSGSLRCAWKDVSLFKPGLSGVFGGPGAKAGRSAALARKANQAPRIKPGSTIEQKLRSGAGCSPAISWQELLRAGMKSRPR